MLVQNSTPARLLNLLLSLAVCAASATAQSSNNAFKNMTLDQAQAAADKEGKIVVVDFFTTLCASCKQIDRITWGDENVRTWLQQKAVALKLDAEKEVEIAKRYKIYDYPTILFLKADGEEIDRIVGFRDPEQFLAEARGSLLVKDGVASAKEKLEGTKENDPWSRMEYGLSLYIKRKYEEALAEYLWCFDESLKHSPAFVGVRGSFLLTDIVRLGRSYPPATDALRERRDAAEKEILSGKANRTQVLDLVNINNKLKNQEQTLAVYDKLKTMDESSKDARSLLAESLIDLLLEAKRYDDIVESTPDPLQKLNTSIAIYERQAKIIASRPALFYMAAHLKEKTVESSAKFYEALLGAGKNELAAGLAGRIIEFDASGKTYATLIKHATRAGAYDVAGGLAESGMKSVPQEQLPAIEKAAAEIPKTPKAK